jgi:hypothetical protein
MRHNISVYESGRPPIVGELAFGVAELAEQLSDAGALGAYLGAGGFQGVFGVQCPLAP